MIVDQTCDSTRNGSAPIGGLAVEPDYLKNVARSCVAYNLRKTARLMTRKYNEAMSASGLRSTQVPILVALEIRGQIMMSDLADELQMENSTLSRNFRLLEDSGLVHRTPVDGRTVNVGITEIGRQMMIQALECWQQIQDETVDAVGTDCWEAALGTLQNLNTLKPSD